MPKLHKNATVALVVTALTLATVACTQHPDTDQTDETISYRLSDQTDFSTDWVEDPLIPEDNDLTLHLEIDAQTKKTSKLKIFSVVDGVPWSHKDNAPKKLTPGETAAKIQVSDLPSDAQYLSLILYLPGRDKERSVLPESLVLTIELTPSSSFHPSSCKTATEHGFGHDKDITPHAQISPSGDLKAFLPRSESEESSAYTYAFYPKKDKLELTGCKTIKTSKPVVSTVGTEEDPAHSAVLLYPYKKGDSIDVAGEPGNFVVATRDSNSD